MSVSLTDSAATHVKNYLEKRGKGVGVRLGVKTTGCSGMAYTIEFADQVEKEDKVFEDKGVKVIINPKSIAPGKGKTFIQNSFSGVIKRQRDTIAGALEITAFEALPGTLEFHLFPGRYIF